MLVKTDIVGFRKRSQTIQKGPTASKPMFVCQPGDKQKQRGLPAPMSIVWAPMGGNRKKQEG